MATKKIKIKKNKLNNSVKPEKYVEADKLNMVYRGNTREPTSYRIKVDKIENITYSCDCYHIDDEEGV